MGPSTSTLFFSDGYNKWRDAKKPTAILAELCRSNGIQPPEYRASEVKVLNKIFKIPPDAVPEGKDGPRRMHLLYVHIVKPSQANFVPYK